MTFYSAKHPGFGKFGSTALGEEGYFRLTAAERDRILPINDAVAWLAGHPAGISLRFETDSAHISVRVKLREPFNMTNLTQIGQCGFDLYVYDGRVHGFALHETVRYDFGATEYEVPLSHFGEAPRVMRKYILNFPLYQTVDSLEIGLDEDAALSPFGFGCGERIVVYGTSIVQGCSASRPGMAPTSLLSRALDAEVLNLGFSGAAFMEREMGEIAGDRRPDVFLLDAEPNAGVDERMEQNAGAFLDAFFERAPEARTVLFSRILFALDLYDEARAKLRDHYIVFLKELVKKYKKLGCRIAFADGSKIFRGNFTEYTADGIHPDSAGMVCLARAYEREIRKMGGVK